MKFKPQTHTMQTNDYIQNIPKSTGSSTFNIDLNTGDPSSLLDAAFASIQNLQNEVFIIMSDIRNLDTEILQLQTKMEDTDSTLQKHYYKQYNENKDVIKPHPKEADLEEKIEQCLKQIKLLNQKKLELCTSLLYTITIKHNDLESSMNSLAAQGQLSPLEFVIAENRDEILKNYFTEKYKSILNNKYIQDGEIVSGEEISETDMDDELESDRKKKGTKRADLKKKESSLGDSYVSGLDQHLHSGNNAQKTMGTGEDEDDQLYCFCQTVSFGEMIACDNNNCKHQWFHYNCVGLNEPPIGLWYCPDCRKNMK
mgnify:CR=1 FL=1